MSLAGWKKAQKNGTESEYFARRREITEENRQSSFQAWKNAKESGTEDAYFQNKRRESGTLEDRYLNVLSDYDNRFSQSLKNYLADYGVSSDSIAKEYDERFENAQKQQERDRANTLYETYAQAKKDYNSAEKEAQTAKRELADHKADTENNLLKKLGSELTGKGNALATAAEEKDLAMQRAKNDLDSAKNIYDDAARTWKLDDAETRDAQELERQENRRRTALEEVKQATRRKTEADDAWQEIGYLNADEDALTAQAQEYRKEYETLLKEYRAQDSAIEIYGAAGDYAGAAKATVARDAAYEKIGEIEKRLTENESYLEKVQEAKSRQETYRLQTVPLEELAQEKDRLTQEKTALETQYAAQQQEKLHAEELIKRAQNVDPVLATPEEIAAAEEIIRRYSGNDAATAMEQTAAQIRELEQKIVEENRMIKTAEILQTQKQYAEVLENEDFDATLARAARTDYNRKLTIEDEITRRAVNALGFDAAKIQENAEYAEQMQGYVLGVNGAPKDVEIMQMEYTQQAEKYRLMTADEKNIFNYLLEKENADAARAYLDTLTETLNARMGSEIAEWWTNGGDYDKSAGKYVYSIIAGANSNLEGVLSAITGKERPTSAYQYASAEILEHMDSDLGGYAYQMGYTVGNMLPNMALSYMTGGVAGALGASAELAATIGSAGFTAGTMLSSGGNAYNQALKEGYSREQAATYGVLTGASEAFMEKVLGGITSMGAEGASRIAQIASKIDQVNAKVMSSRAANTAVKFISTALSEGSEEYLQSILEPVYRNLVLGEENDVELFTEEALESAILGALTGILFETGGIIAEGKDAKAYGEHIYELNSETRLYEMAKEQGGEAAELAAVIEYGTFSEKNKAYALGTLAAKLEESGVPVLETLEKEYREISRPAGKATTLGAEYAGITPERTGNSEISEETSSPDANIQEQTVDVKGGSDVLSPELEGETAKTAPTLETVKKSATYQGDAGYWNDERFAKTQEYAQQEGYVNTQNMELAGRCTAIFDPYDRSKGEVPENIQGSRESTTITQEQLGNAKKIVRECIDERMQMELEYNESRSDKKPPNVRVLIKNKLKKIYGGDATTKIPETITIKNVMFNGKEYEIRFPNTVYGKVSRQGWDNGITYAVLEQIPRLIENAEYVGSSNYNKTNAGRKESIVRYDHFESVFQIEGNESEQVLCFDARVGRNKISDYRTHRIIELENFRVNKTTGKVTGKTSRVTRGSMEGTSSLTLNIRNSGTNVNREISENRGNFAENVQNDVLTPEIERDTAPIGANEPETTVLTAAGIESNHTELTAEEIAVRGTKINGRAYTVHTWGKLAENFLKAESDLTMEQKREILGNLRTIIENAVYVGTDADIYNRNVIRTDHLETDVQMEDGATMIVKLAADMKRGETSPEIVKIEIADYKKNNDPNSRGSNRSTIPLRDGAVYKGTSSLNANIQERTADVKGDSDVLSPEIEGEAAGNAPTLETVKKSATYQEDAGYWTDEKFANTQKHAQQEGYANTQNMELAGRCTVIFDPYDQSKGEIPENIQGNRESTMITQEQIRNAKEMIKECFEKREMEGNKKSKKYYLKEKLKSIYKFDANKPKTEKKIPQEIQLQNVNFAGLPYIVNFTNGVYGKISTGEDGNYLKYAVMDQMSKLIQNAEYVGSGTYNKINEIRANNVTRYDYFETPFTVEESGNQFVLCFDVRIGRNKHNEYRTHVVKEIVNINVKENAGEVTSKLLGSPAISNALSTPVSITQTTSQGVSEGTSSLTPNIRNSETNVNREISENRGNFAENVQNDILTPEIEGENRSAENAIALSEKKAGSETADFIAPEIPKDAATETQGDIYKSVYENQRRVEDAEELEKLRETSEKALEQMRKKTNLTRRERRIAEELVNGIRKNFPAEITEERKADLRRYMAGYEAYLHDAKHSLAQARSISFQSNHALGAKDTSDAEIVRAQKSAQQELRMLNEEIERLSKAWNFTEKDNNAAENLAKGTQAEYTLAKDIQENGVKRKATLLKRKMALEKQLKNARIAAKLRIQEEVRGLTVNADEWSNLKGSLRYELRTPERALRAAMKNDVNAKDAMRYFIGSVHENNAERTRWVNGWNDRMRPFGELFGAADQAIAMEYAEDVIKETELPEYQELTGKQAKILREYDLTQYMTEDGKLKYREAMTAYKNVTREFFDEALEKTNITLAKQGMPLVEGLKNYVPHMGDGSDPVSRTMTTQLNFGDEITLDGSVSEIRKVLQTADKNSTAQKLSHALGMDIISADKLNARLTGLTEDFRPNKQWVGNFEHRNGVTTDYNLAKNYDAYIEKVSRVIYMTENIQRIRGLETELRTRNSPENIRSEINALRSNPELTEEARQQQIDLLTAKIDAGPEGFINWTREYGNLLAGKKSHFDRPLEKSAGRQAMLMVGRGAGFVARNLISFNPGTAVTNFIPIAQAMGEVDADSAIRGFREGIATLGKRADEFTTESDFIVNRSGTSPIYKTGWDKYMDASGWMMEAFDAVATNIVPRIYYYDAVKKGMSHETALEYANRHSADLMGDRSLGAQPTLMSAQTLKPLTQFQLENFNFYYHYLSDFPAYAKEHAVMRRSAKRGLSADDAYDYAADNAAAYNRLTETEKRGAALHLTKSAFQAAVALYLGNMIIQAIRGRKATYDPLGELLGEDPLGLEKDTEEARREELRNMSLEQLIEEGEGDTFWNDLLSLVSGLAGDVPILSNFTENASRPAMMTPLQGFDSLEDFLEGFGEMDERWLDYLDIVGYLLPTGGYGQLRKTAQGAQALLKGGVYQKTDTGEKLKYTATDGSTAERIAEVMKNILFGASATDQAGEYYDTFRTILTEQETAGYQKLIKDQEIKLDPDEYIKIAFGLGSLEDDELTGNEVKKEKLRYLLENYAEQADFLTEYLVMSKAEREEYDEIRTTGLGAADYMACITAEKKDAEMISKKIEKIEDPEQRDAAAYAIMPESDRDHYDIYRAEGIGAADYFAVTAAEKGKDTAAEKRAARLQRILQMDHLTQKQKLTLAQAFDTDARAQDLKYPEILEKYGEIAGDDSIAESKNKAAAFYEYLEEKGYSENQRDEIMRRFTFGGTDAEAAQKASDSLTTLEKYGVDDALYEKAKKSIGNAKTYKIKAQRIDKLNATSEQKYALMKELIFSGSEKNRDLCTLAEAVGIDYDDFIPHFIAAEEYYDSQDRGGLENYLNEQDLDGNTENIIYCMITGKQKRYNSKLKDLLAKTGWSEMEKTEFYERRKRG